MFDHNSRKLLPRNCRARNPVGHCRVTTIRTSTIMRKSLKAHYGCLSDRAAATGSTGLRRECFLNNLNVR